MSTQKTTATPPLLHLAIIMDGNGRWAKERNLSRSEGHKAGAISAKTIVKECLSLGIPYLTLYTFSTENWKRPAEEIKFLFDLLLRFITKELPDLEKQGIKLSILGEMKDLPFATRKALEHACSKTQKNKRLQLNLALNYSGREEIARAFRECVKAGIDCSNITPEILEQYLYTAGQPDPDLIIRTSGEFRVSNFLLFQSAYSEFYFTKTRWPDFSSEELKKALDSYASRNRKYGNISK